VPAGAAMDEAMALAATIATKPPATVAIGKEAFYRQIEMSLADAYDYAAGVMIENMMHREAEEGIGAFLKKRTPVWPKG
jgi:enoyl-CoA hydratase/carnithine racemase